MSQGNSFPVRLNDLKVKLDAIKVCRVPLRVEAREVQVNFDEGGRISAACQAFSKAGQTKKEVAF